MLHLKDPIGTDFELESTPQRIISLVPSLTETLCDLGLEDKLIGITKFCVHPFHLKSTKKIIGGTKKVHYEKIRLLNPDFIIANKEENTEEMVVELRKICPVWVTDIATVEDVMQTITDFGKLFNCRMEARKWNDKIAHNFADFKLFSETLEVRKSAYFIWKNPYMVAGTGTFIDALLQLNKFDNCYKNLDRYPEIDLESLEKEHDPEVILLSSEPYPFSDADAFEIGRNTHHAKTIFVDGEMFSWYGTRLHKSFDYFKKIHSKLV
ncbi:ABC transporter substrate-binding protein [Flavobacterium antarcticum]|uniref:ABC transporter substrate-binding protein n=1 Tax=Flavobacterium antarcticum TaxID=271155 RepID=UPI0003B58E8C|nr:helical backbone metal receptor [Flavobacterium antarcticum]